jgi:hypothetical protein
VCARIRLVNPPKRPAALKREKREREKNKREKHTRIVTTDITTVSKTVITAVITAVITTGDGIEMGSGTLSALPAFRHPH